MDASWYRDVVEQSISRHGKPELFNTDQGSQVTSEISTGLPLENEIKISMDGRGRGNQ
jgi:putative transposase